MRKYKFTSVVWIACFFSETNLVQADIIPLESRLGGLAYYDANLDITWAADATINGSHSWDDQKAWAATLNLGGVTGWRLPNADVNGNATVVGCSATTSEIVCADNEMGFLFWKEGINNVSLGPFQHVGLVDFWSNTEWISDPDSAWQFFFNSGAQITSLKSANRGAWAVHDGDVADLGTPGDFDFDGDVDGDDFLLWQRNPSIGLLSDWESHYATTLVAANVVPEPNAAALCLLAIVLIFGHRVHRDHGEESEQLPLSLSPQ